MGATRPILVPLVLAGTCAWSCAPQVEAAAEEVVGEAGARPNILFVFTDDQRFDAMGAAGHPFLRTPNMDRLAREGLRFENAFVTTSLCSPSRASFLTGTYAHTHGVRLNATLDPDPRLPRFPNLLQEAGYETAYIGKWHMKAGAQPRPGFDYWLSFSGQGEYSDPELNENGRAFEAEGYMTDVLTDYAVKWLEERARDRPFCMVFGHKAPHSDYLPAERHAGAFSGAKLAQPASWSDHLDDKPFWLRETMVRGVGKRLKERLKDRPVPDALPEEPWDPELGQRRMDYFRTLLAVDESLGRLLGVLEETAQLDETFVVFSSDNGFCRGEHRSWGKALMYESSIRIPMLVRYPKLVAPRSTRSEMVLNIDVAPTLLEAAGVRVPDTVQGRSWLPLLRDEDTQWRRSFLYEYFLDERLPGHPDTEGVRTAEWKYITCPNLDDVDELYDLESDPHELENLAMDPRYHEKLAEMRAELARLKRETDA